MEIADIISGMDVTQQEIDAMKAGCSQVIALLGSNQLRIQLLTPADTMFKIQFLATLEI